VVSPTIIYGWGLPLFLYLDEIWTVKVPLKNKVAKQNGLRYIESWNLDQVQHWLDKYRKAKRFSKGML
jgi:hypothetical protein